MKRTLVALASSLATLSITAAAAARSPEAPRDPFYTRGAVMAGLNQWIVFGGGNVAAQLQTGRWAFEYSHGQALDFNRAESLALTEDERDAGVQLSMPWTTGGGVGFRILPNLQVLLEVKAHRYEVRGADRNESLSYTSLTVGPGVFYEIYLWEGLFLQPSLRWWPTVASSYDGKGTLTAKDGSTYRHERHDLLPFINVNLGWTFGYQG